MTTRSKRKPSFLDESNDAQETPTVPEIPTRASKRKAEIRPDRVGKRGKIFYMNEAAEKQLSILAIEQDTTQQELLIGAVNALFVKYDKPPIA
jgi:hypothetical protein